MDLTKYSVEEIRDMLIDAGVDESVVAATKGKKLLKLLVDEHLGDKPSQTISIENTPNPFEQAVVEGVGETEIEDVERVPKYSDPEWGDYALSQFTSEEVDQDGHPLLIGLRRVTESLLGEVVSSRPVNFSYNNGAAICSYEVDVLWKRDDILYFNEQGSGGLTKRTFGSIADAHEGNTDEFFQKYLTTISESRAEARTYRKALQLKVVAKDELCDKNTKKFKKDENDVELITNTQITFIGIKCGQRNIDKELLAKQEYKKDFKKLTRDEASDLMVTIDKYQRNEKEIPEGILIK